MTNWDEAWPFERYVVQLILDKKTDTAEFKLLVRIYGREKLVEIWEKYRRNATR